MQKIIPCIWCVRNAEEAVDYYTSIFPNAKKTKTTYYPAEGLLDFQKEFAGKVLSMEFETAGFRFLTLNAGPEFSPNPSVSFMLNFDPAGDNRAEEHLNEIWEKLIDGGEALMPLQQYPFSRRYGWVRDRFNVTWQLILTDPKGDPRPFIIPSLMFCGKNNGRAEEALRLYTSVFPESATGTLVHYTDDTGPAGAGALMFGDFTLAGQWFAAMDAGTGQAFSFNEGISLIINCRNQAEIDYYWDILTGNGGEESVCGWLRDRYGLSWQVAPEGIDEMTQNPEGFSKMLQMKKIIIRDLI
jgi:predicted 3-demethylubiquinone-9 3-methyltransferase (glyoxalase superfamily)